MPPKAKTLLHSAGSKLRHSLAGQPARPHTPETFATLPPFGGCGGVAVGLYRYFSETMTGIMPLPLGSSASALPMTAPKAADLSEARIAMPGVLLVVKRSAT